MEIDRERERERGGEEGENRKGGYSLLRTK